MTFKNNPTLPHCLWRVCVDGIAFVVGVGVFIMKEIKLTQGKVALVDDGDYDFLMQWKWQAHFKDLWYAVRTQRMGKKRICVRMHRVILGLIDPNVKGDHKDGDGLNNQRGNLRIATTEQNAQNRRACSKSNSKYIGVHLRIKTGKYIAQIAHNKNKKHIGCFETAEKAALAYNKAAFELFGEFARLNVIDSEYPDKT